jgi:hypothetical protein
MATATNLRIGSEVMVSFKLTNHDGEPHKVPARIVRIDQNKQDPDGLWPFMVAVEFEDEVPDLEQLLHEASSPGSIAVEPPDPPGPPDQAS